MNIFIFKNRAMGDAIIGLGAVSYLRTLFPQAKIYYGVPQWVAPLFSKIHTDADEIIPVNLSSLSGWGELWKNLKAKNINFIYEMFQTGRGSKFSKLYCRLNEIPYFFHNHHYKKGSVKDQGVIKPVIQRDLDGLYSHLNSHEVQPNYLNFPPEIWCSRHVPNKKQIIFGIVATRKTKQWTLKGYVDIAKKIYEINPEIKIIVPLSHSVADIALKKDFLAYVPPSNVKIVHADLADLPKLFFGSRLYLGNDTGIKHLAVALNIPTWTFFGPEPPLEWHPYDQKKHKFFYLDNLECRTKISHYCGLSSCESMLCMEHFHVDEVWKRVQEECKDLFIP